MSIPSNEIAAAVFKPVLNGDIGEFSLDGQMLKLLLVLDGKKDVASVAHQLQIKIGTARDVINKLLELQLVERVESAESLLDEEFFEFLQAQLSLATGPIAEVMIEDVLHELGMEPTKAPKRRAAEIVDALSRQIPRDENRRAFQQVMVTRIREKGY